MDPEKSRNYWPRMCTSPLVYLGVCACRFSVCKCCFLQYRYKEAQAEYGYERERLLERIAALSEEIESLRERMVSEHEIRRIINPFMNTKFDAHCIHYSSFIPLGLSSP